ncbi:nusB family protein [Neorickettsia helminthoeca str. Oregon]|uniref:NusB family protein n=1 Tax=Neorickettsia helminthoeca str. Oregon TaxID=1286528 RepID=X5GXH4_9RICK|nr:transcription antitermination factor NusB [Neorickettsia helminthoeca]AHX11757.1 nusB family protein [Neorickettsia helminthoeca str. Oregon]
MLSKRRIARLLSVEVCYSSYFSDLDQNVLLKKALDLHDVSYMRKYDPTLLDPLLELCFSNLELDAQVIERFLSEDWNINRIDNLKLSILRVAISELRLTGLEQKNLVIDEYVTLSRLFLPMQDSNFINAILDKLAGEIERSPGEK